MSMAKPVATVFFLSVVSIIAHRAYGADDPKPVAKAPVPEILPGKGLAEHDFLYAGENKSQNIYIVRKGEVAWSYEGPQGKGEISDAVMLSSGNILFAHQFGVTLLSPEKKVLWHRDADPKSEIHTAQPIDKELVVFVQNGDPAKAVVMNTRTNAVEREFDLPVGNPRGVHGHFRHARLTKAGTLLVAHMDMKKVCEYDSTGKQVWAVDVAEGPWAASRLANGNTLVSGTQFVREVDEKGKPVWEFSAADVPQYKLTGFQIAQRLPSGNTLINNWVNPWSVKIDPETAPVQALEVTPEKKVVWALRSWKAPANLGPATTIQLLDDGAPAEEVHFGEFK